MATRISRSAARSVANLSKALAAPKPAAEMASAANISRRSSPLVCRSIALASLGSMESLLPLHSAVASARLKSFIAADSSCWSWLSQGRALPL